MADIPVFSHIRRVQGNNFQFPYVSNDSNKRPADRRQAAAEALVVNASSSKMATCALRPSVLCGPGDYQLVPAIHACIAKYETPFIIGDGLNLWDVTHVSNIADAHVLAVENLVTSRTASGEAFFIQNNEPITFRNFCLAIWAHFGHVPPFEIRIPEGLAYFAGLVCEMVTWATGTTTTLSRGSVRDACAMRYASGKKAREVLGYEARIGIEEGIRLSCEVSGNPDTPTFRGLSLGLISHMGTGLCPAYRGRSSTSVARTGRQTDFMMKIGDQRPLPQWLPNHTLQ